MKRMILTYLNAFLRCHYNYIGKALSCVLLIFFSYNLSAQTIVTYTQQAANYYTTYSSGSNCTVSNTGSYQMRMQARVDGSKQVVAWRKFRTDASGINTGDRSMQVGDQFVVTLSATQAYGKIGFALLASPSTGSWANRESNYAISINLDGPGDGGSFGSKWYVKYNGGAKSLASFSGVQGTSVNGGFHNYTFTLTLTAPDRMNVVMTDNTTSTTSNFYDLQLNTSNPITDYSVFYEDDWDNAFNQSVYWGLGAIGTQHSLTNGGSLSIGQSNNSFTESGILTNGLDANSSSANSLNNSLIKAGTGTLTLSGANVYKGSTTITAGTLQLGAANALPVSSPGTIVLNGGTLSTGATTGYGVATTGTLTLNANSTIALGTGSHALKFAASSGISWTSGKVLTITGWTGTAGSSGTAGQIFVGTGSTDLTATQLAQIQFAGYGLGAVTQLSTGEIVPAGVATPSIAISSNSPAAGNILPGSTSQIIHTIKMVVTSVDASLTGITVTTAGGYTTSDFTNFKLWINTSNSLSGATQLGSTITSSVASGGNLAFTSGASLPYSMTVATGTYYILVTCDVSVSAVVNDHINIASTAFSNITFASGTKTGTDPVAASNNQTVFAWSITDFYIYVGGTGYYLNGTGGQGSTVFNGASISTNNFYLTDTRLYTSRYSSQSICSGTLYYSIYPSAGSPSTWNSLSLPNVISGSSTGSSGTSEALQASSPNINIGCGLINGTSYKLAVYYTFSGNSSSSICPGTADVYTLNNSGSYYILTFTYTNSAYTPTYTSSASASTCINTSVTYTTQPGMSNYVWSVPGTSGVDYTITSGGIGTGNNTVTLKWLTTGSKTVTVYYTNGGCTASSSASSTTTVVGTPTTSNAGTAQSICSSGSVTLAANTPTVGTGTWSVSGPSSSTTQFSSTSNPSATFTPAGGAGTYTLTWTISNSPCTQSTSNVIITVNSTGTWLGVTSTDWNTASNWCGGIPTAATNVIIPTGTTYSPIIGTANAVANSITINSSATLAMSGTYNLTITSGGSITNNGTFTAGTGTVIFAGSGNVSGSSATTFNNITLNGATTFSTAPAINGTLLLNSGSSVSGSSPTYACSSTLIYNTGNFPQNRGPEWTTATSGTGYPGNVQISNSTRLNGNASGSNNIALCGTLTIDANSAVYMDYGGVGNSTLTVGGNIIINGDLTLGHGVGGDLYLYGNYTHASTGSINFIGRSVQFIGTGTQVITHTGGGTEDFNGTGIPASIIINKASGNVQLNNSIPTNVLMSDSSGDVLQILNSGGLDLNGQIFTMNSIGGNIKVSGGVRNITSSIVEGIFFIADNTTHNQSSVYKAITNASGGSLVFGSNVKVLISGGIDFGTNLTTINDTLQYNQYGHTNNSGPYYGNASTLVYNTGNYLRHIEWNSNTPGTTAYPHNVLIGNGMNTAFSLYNSIGAPVVNTTMGCSGSLTISSGSSFTADPMPTGANLSVGTDINIAGSLTLSSNSGSDLYVGSSWNRSASGTWTSNSRWVYLNGSANGTITASGGETFPYLSITKSTTSAKVSLADSVAITKELLLTEGVFDLVNKNVTIVSTISNTASIGTTTIPANISLPYSGTGKFYIERYIQTGHRAWRLLTAPISSSQTINDSWQEGQTNTATSGAGQSNTVPGYGTEVTYKIATVSSTGYDKAVTNNPSIQYLSGGAWAVPTDTKTTPINQYPGYMLFVRGDRSVVVTTPPFNPTTPTVLRVHGTINVGAKSFTPASSGFQVIGNPYASAISLDNIFATYGTTIGSNYYVWDPLMTGTQGVGAFFAVSYNGSAGNYTMSSHLSPFSNGRIESSEAYLINFANTGSITFNETDKTVQNALVFRPVSYTPSQSFTIVLNSVNPDNSLELDDGAIALYGSQYSDSVYWLEDAQKLTNPAENVSILRNGKNIAIDKSTSLHAADTIFLNLAHMKQQKNYQFAFIASDIFNRDLQARLEDTYAGTSIPVSLIDTTFVNFTVTADASSQGTDRFRIVFDSITSGSLPVNYTNIKAWQLTNTITVQWKVEEQQNVSKYIIERSSDGQTFDQIGIIAANSSLVYDWIDTDPLNSENYYRIISVDINGMLTYSHIVQVKMGNNAPGITVYPNPVKDNIWLQFTNMPKGNYSIHVFNAIGQAILNTKLVHNGGSSIQNMPFDAQLSKGLYQLEIIKPDNSRTTINLFH